MDFNTNASRRKKIDVKCCAFFLQSLSSKSLGKTLSSAVSAKFKMAEDVSERHRTFVESPPRSTHRQPSSPSCSPLAKGSAPSPSKIAIAMNEHFEFLSDALNTAGFVTELKPLTTIPVFDLSLDHRYVKDRHTDPVNGSMTPAPSSSSWNVLARCALDVHDCSLELNQIMIVLPSAVLYVSANVELPSLLYCKMMIRSSRNDPR